MVNISKSGIITLSIGDSFETTLFLNRGSSIYPVRYELKDSDYVELALLYPHSNYEDAILYKTYTKEDLDENGDVKIKFNSNDTINLKEGLYYYTIKIFSSDGESGEIDINTIVPRTQFRLYR